MFERDVSFPTAVASYDDEGVDAALAWCRGHLRDGDTLTVWTSLKSNLSNCPQLEDFVRRYSNVDHVTGRGGARLRGTGPVLMAWADMDDIGELVRYGSKRVRALCVITWNEDWLRPWVAANSPDILGDGSAWTEPAVDVDPVVVEALKSITSAINHNNTIAAGFEKDIVVSALLALKAARVPMDPGAMQAWTLSHGWSGKNPAHLAKYVTDINAGKRPRASWKHGPEYVARLREAVNGTETGSS